MEDWREKDSGTKGEAFGKRVVFNGNGGGLLMWVYALSSLFFLFSFLWLLGFEGFKYENENKGFIYEKIKMALLTSAKVVHNTSSYHDTFKKN